MIVTFDRVPHADNPAETVTQWGVRTGGHLVAGGYSNNLEDATVDATAWIKGRRVLLSCDCHWSDDEDLPHTSPGPCFGRIDSVMTRDGVFVLVVLLEPEGWFLYENGADGDVLFFDGFYKPESPVLHNQVDWPAVQSPDGRWIGSNNMVMCYKDTHTARVVMTMLWQHSREKICRYRVRPFRGEPGDVWEPEPAAMQMLCNFNNRLKETWLKLVQQN